MRNQKIYTPATSESVIGDAIEGERYHLSFHWLLKFAVLIMGSLSGA